MEREQEISRLVNVLRKTARTAQMKEWTGSDEEAAAYSITRYNRVRTRLVELEPGADAIFDELPKGSSLSVIALACRQLAAYFEEEASAAKGWGRVYGAAFDADAFKDFWRHSARDIEDLGEFIRENIETWAQRRSGSPPADDAPDDAPKDAPNTG